MTTTIAPCKQPRVVVVHDRHNDTTGAHCQIYGCNWKYGPGVKTDVEQQATRHRQAHRAAVPLHELGGPTVNLNYFASCECGWTSGPGVVTRTDNKAVLDHHLSAVHGLVA